MMKIIKNLLIFFLVFYNLSCFAQEEPKKISLKMGKHKDFYRIVLYCEEEQVKDLLQVVVQKNNKLKITFPEKFYIEFQGKILKEDEIIKDFTIKNFDSYYIINTPPFNDYKIYKLPSPHRIVIDIFPNQIISTENTNIKTSFLTVIDAGHGGKDLGIFYQNFMEKDLTLFLAKEIHSKLTQKGIKSLLTRDSDIELSLKDRLNFLENQKTGIFLSIHLSNDENFKLYYNKKIKFLEKFSDLLKNKIEKNYSDPLLIEKIFVYQGKDSNLNLFMIEIPKKYLSNDKNHLNKFINSIVEALQELKGLKINE